MKLIIISLITLTIGIGLYSTRTNSQDIVEFNVGFSDPDSRTKYMMERRGGSFNNKAIEDAKNKITRALNNNEIDVRDGAINGWDKLGPYNMGGRTRAIAIDPNDGDHIFIGVSAGGIWETTDGGGNWSLSTPFLDSHPVMDIQYHPSNSNIMLAVTGEYNGGGPEYPGVGVMRSLNGGSTWTKMNQPSGYDFKYLSKVRFHPTTPSIVYVCGSKRDVYGSNDEGVIYKSINDGLDWTLHYTDPTTSGNIYDFEINSSIPDKMIFGNEKSAYFSEDGGNSWDECSFSNVSSVDYQRVEVEICKADPSVVYALRYATRDFTTYIDYRTLLERSIDYGENFDQETSTMSSNSSNNILGKQGNYDNVLWINDQNCNSVVMGGLDLWRYNVGDSDPTKISDWIDDIDGNAGGTNNSVHADHHVIVSHPDFNNNSNTTVFFGNDGGIYKTDNIKFVTPNDDDWESLVTDLNITQLYGGDVSFDGETLVGGAQDNGYMFDTNNDDGLGDFEIYSTGDGGYCRIDKTNSSVFYTTTQKGDVYKTTNGGTTFCHIFSMTGSTQIGCCDCGTFSSDVQWADFIAPLIMNPTNSDHLLLGGNTLHETKDGGITWQNILDIDQCIGCFKISALDISSQDDKVIWLGGKSSDVLKTESGGPNLDDYETFDENNKGLPDNQVTDIAIHPLNHDKVMVTYSGYHQTHIYLTKDGGDTWTNRSLDFDMQVNTVVWHPELPDFVYVGTDIGIFASENSGEDWSINPYYSNGEGPAYVSVEELFWQGNGTNINPFYLMAATHGRGFWRTEVPIRSKYYVDKNCFFCGENTVGAPYQFFENAVEAANKGATVIFQSTGSHDEVPPTIIVEKQLKVVSENGSAILK